jgi:hypothetical protein
MKTVFNYLTLAFSIIILSIKSTDAQVGTFSATLTQQETMLVSWSMLAGLTCIDLELEHAGKDLNFESIYLHNGICGSIDKEEYYNFEHESNIETVNYYRIKLGFAGFSDTIRVEAPLLGSNGLLVYPQPSNDLVNLQFNNPKADNYSLTIFNSSGSLIRIVDQFKGNVLQLSTQEMASGLYFFKLQSNYISHTGRFLIKH